MQRQRAEPDVRRARPDDRRIRGVVDPAHRDVGISARNMQALDPFAVDQSHLGDRRRLAQKSQRVESMAIVETLEPRQLDRPIHLRANAVEEGLNLAGRRIRFGAQARTQIGALIAVAEPRIAGPVDDEGNNDRNEQN